jgi:hypothetical protein
MKRRRFFDELSPWARKIQQMADETPLPLSIAKDVPSCLEKQAAKLKRRADRARKAGQLLKQKP